MRRSGAWLGFCLLLSACGGVLSDHPLSSEPDSVVDERLIGWWEQLPTQDRTEDDGAREPGRRLLVGRVSGTDHTLELVALKLEPDDTVTVERQTIHTVRLGGVWHLSLAAEDEQAFIIARYRIDEDGRLTLEGLDERGTAAAIDGAAIRGRVGRNPKYGGPGSGEREFKEVRLTAETAALRAWVAGAGQTAFARTSRPFLRKLAIPRPGHGKRTVK
jgi:hypothetical protein